MTSSPKPVGDFCYALATRLFPICRSITGNGVRETLRILGEHLHDLEVHEVPSGTRAFDWTVPPEWNITEAFIEDEEGNRVIDFADNNLHVVGYSVPVDEWMSLEDLQEHLHSLPDQPTAIPYVTSYYSPRWGFCLSHNQRRSLRPGRYHAVIRSTLTAGSLTYGELLLRGQTAQEIFVSTYVCHPSMGNNELSGPVVATALAMAIQAIETRRYTYRFVFIPETIGSIVYLSRNLEQLKRNVVAGFNVTCVGDDRAFSYLPSRDGETLADVAAKHALKHIAGDFRTYSWLDRGSDERQYCAPGVDLPVCSIMRTRYGDYKEYHTSLDDLSLISPAGLEGGFRAIRAALDAIEKDVRPKIMVLCEPQLGKRGLYPTLGSKGTGDDVHAMTDLISYCDGRHTLLEIAQKIDRPVWELAAILAKLASAGLIETDPILPESGDRTRADVSMSDAK
jgi:aminopeptidase-like protein